MTTPFAKMAEAREEFLELVASIRPELHRYCARLTGSVIEGEDVVQDALAKAFYSMSQSVEAPPLRPWLFRIAHNTAIDFLRSHGRSRTELMDEMDDIAVSDVVEDPIDVRAALSRFLALPLSQRSAVILKDVLGHSLEETARTMGTSVMAVKAALSRARKSLRDDAGNDDATSSSRDQRALERYATLFNARDWDGVRAMVAEDCRLDLVAKSQRRGKAVGMYFGNYAKLNVTLRVVRLEGQLALAAYVEGSERPSYVILLQLAEEDPTNTPDQRTPSRPEDAMTITSIRDYRYVPYIMDDAELEPV